MNRTHDVIVVGAGPAGVSAATQVAAAGLTVALLDEAPAAGGQVYRAPPPNFVFHKATADERDGDALRHALAESTVDYRPERRVWSITPGFRVDALGPRQCESYSAPQLIAATGAHERVIPFPGWTLPGVIGLAAATVLLKSQAMTPGRRVVVAGCGPLLAATAAKVVAAGGEVAAIVDLASRRDWLRAAPALASRPRLLAQGLRWTLSLAARRVPIFFRHAILRADGNDAVARVTIGAVSADGSPVGGNKRVFDVDSLVVGHGLVPSSEIPSLLRAEHRYDRARGGWIPVVDDSGRTSIAGLYAVGDGAMIAGAIPAMLTGRLAGLAAAEDAGRRDAARSAAPIRADLARHARFAAAMAEMMALRPGLVRGVADDAVVCRCEDVTRSEIDAAIAAGARELNQLKHFTRCGMGPCQGRMCGETAAELMALHTGSREAAGRWTARPPLRPVPLANLLGDFSYDDIPAPEPAPL